MTFTSIMLTVCSGFEPKWNSWSMTSNGETMQWKEQQKNMHTHTCTHRLMHYPSYLSGCVTQHSCFHVSVEMKNDSCFIAWKCQGIRLNSAEPMGERFSICLFFISNSAGLLQHFFFIFGPTQEKQNWINVWLKLEWRDLYQL